MITFSDVEKDIFSNVLEQASDVFSNHGCNNFPVLVTEENRQGLIDFIDNYAEDEDEKASLLENVIVGKKIYFNDLLLLASLKDIISKS